MKDNGGMWSCRAGTEQKFRDQLCHMLEGGGVSRRWARCHRLQRGWHVLIRTLKLLPEEMQTPDRGWLAVAAKECSETAVLCVRWDQRAALHVCIFCFSIGEHPGLIWTKPLSSFRDSAPAL